MIHLSTEETPMDGRAQCKKFILSQNIQYLGSCRLCGDRQCDIVRDGDAEHEALKDAVVEAAVCLEDARNRIHATALTLDEVREAHDDFAAAVEALRLFRTPKVEPEVERCEPPEWAKREKYHWLTADDGTEAPYEWDCGQWCEIYRADAISPEYLGELGWKWHSVAKPGVPADLQGPSVAKPDARAEPEFGWPDNPGSFVTNGLPSYEKWRSLYENWVERRSDFKPSDLDRSLDTGSYELFTVEGGFIGFAAAMEIAEAWKKEDTERSSIAKPLPTAVEPTDEVEHTVSREVYESAVKGRQDFRNAFRQAKAEIADLTARIKSYKNAALETESEIAALRTFKPLPAEIPRLTDAEIEALTKPHCTEWVTDGNTGKWVGASFDVPDLIELIRSIESKARGEV
jgi:hypothetical protein